EPVAERARMFLAEDLRVRIVVEKPELLSPRDEHWKSRLEQESDDGAERLRPGGRIAERRRGPVVRPHERANVPAAGEKVRRLTHSGKRAIVCHPVACCA